MQTSLAFLIQSSNRVILRNCIILLASPAAQQGCAPSPEIWLVLQDIVAFGLRVETRVTQSAYAAS